MFFELANISHWATLGLILYGMYACGSIRGFDRGYQLRVKEERVGWLPRL